MSKQKMRHRPTVAIILSILFAGLGQLYNRRYVKGILFIVIEAVFLITFYNFLNIGLWGLITLGEIPMVDHSIFLLIQGLVSVIIIAFAAVLYYFNIIDARKDALRLQRGEPFPSLLESCGNVWDKGFPYVFVTPGLIMLLFVVVLPLLFMVSLAFTDYNLYNSPPRHLLHWVGFKNFKNLVSVPIWQDTFFSVFAWTIVWTIVATTLQIALGLFLAILVNDPRIKFKRFIRTVLILPWAVPAFVTILVFAAMFNDKFGAINRDILSAFGVMIPWMTDPFWTKVALILIQTWLGFPFVFALFTGVLQSISRDWYEAAEMDGATRWQKFRSITLPHVLYATAPLLIMQYAGNFNNFNIIYLFNDGGPAVRGQNAGGTDILISWVYDLTFTTNNYNMAAAISIIIGLIVSGFALYQFRRTRSFKEEGNI
ncbi:carbohydrate ABC transporter permease [Saccharococcus caldoxylosilyticus]|uniref:Maltose/maltodextrin transport system permease protein n=1 Tax=Parageobacillus caldoxylosilyticus NBRC 107762 TaxID=1220594 RepID=A0A023DEC9_9BACL|nr:sugar ABC transporter permease [Parageobacillus caldoxylosilyticus]MBB3852734.1 arabinogalactan oligomer/maltooligosaccharide transport system permease protein [Parageobacillus caldoxylosilyticus]BDG34741.1 sugar ABC transporter permease [Parageobacillus caldoxylosilyticus]BDG38515.1 sugar ABC transporter permease [Parageobacillus caldoxylosilyticus]GAJ39583.1 maltose/maltodextrin ABC transporter permease protein [Parageobacillus caldoxylosilyticus NBRC 107762]